jgi:DNA-binding GntR family transcriptional regulator
LANPLQKVCAQLLNLSIETSVTASNSKIADIPTHQELAIMINTSRETVTRVFQLLQVKNLVIRDGNDLVIKQIKLLKEIAEGIRSAP